MGAGGADFHTFVDVDVGDFTELFGRYGWTVVCRLSN